MTEITTTRVLSGSVTAFWLFALVLDDPFGCEAKARYETGEGA